MTRQAYGIFDASSDDEPVYYILVDRSDFARDYSDDIGSNIEFAGTADECYRHIRTLSDEWGFSAGPAFHAIRADRSLRDYVRGPEHRASKYGETAWRMHGGRAVLGCPGDWGTR